MNANVVRIHLKPDTVYREQVIDFCLMNPNKQYIIMGWSCLYKDAVEFSDFGEFYNCARNKYNRINPVFNVFLDTETDYLFWTRDLDGYYWICRATGKAEPFLNKELDIGARIPVEAYQYGMGVPGAIKASFNRPRGGIIQRFKDKSIIEFSKFCFNRLSKRDVFSIEPFQNDVLSNMPDFDLEELVISFIQLKNNYYLLSGSIARKSTTVKIECELISRDLNHPKKAVVQVKGGKEKTLDAKDYATYVEKGCEVFLYADSEKISNTELVDNIRVITRDELTQFFEEYQQLLPENITRWKDLIYAANNSVQD